MNKVNPQAVAMRENHARARIWNAQLDALGMDCEDLSRKTGILPVNLPVNLRAILAANVQASPVEVERRDRALGTEREVT